MERIGARTRRHPSRDRDFATIELGTRAACRARMQSRLWGVMLVVLAGACSDSTESAPPLAVDPADPHSEEQGAYPEPSDDPSVGAIEDAEASTPSPPAEDAGASDAGSTAVAAKIASPVPGKVVTYAFGVKNPRYAAGYHTGEDYAAPVGLPVVAVRSGTIRWSNDNGGAYGKWMGLDADNGRTYVYCHLSSRSLSAGTKVTAGQTLGKVGATGNVTGPHLHFEDHPLGPFKYAQVRKPQW